MKKLLVPLMLIAVLVFGVVGLLLVVQAAAMEVNTDRPGMDYKSFPIPTADPAICESRCLTDPQCQAWTYVKPGVQGQSAVCWLKNGVPHPVFDQCCISGIKERSPGLPSPGMPGPSYEPSPGINLPDLQITNISIHPEPMLHPRLQLHMSRSYRFHVSILNRGVPSPAFTVRTECSRGGMPATLGEVRVGPIPAGQSRDVVYDVFPSSAGAGNCMMRTTVDADGQVKESDESPLSNTWNRAVIVLP